MRALLEVNVLIALLDGAHVGHTTASAWLAREVRQGWASCPLTQNGCVRIMSQPAYPGALSAAEVALRLAQAAGHASHTFRARGQVLNLEYGDGEYDKFSRERLGSRPECCSASENPGHRWPPDAAVRCGELAQPEPGLGKRLPHCVVGSHASSGSHTATTAGIGLAPRALKPSRKT